MPLDLASLLVLIACAVFVYALYRAIDEESRFALRCMVVGALVLLVIGFWLGWW